jgi:hypothetical protein
MSRSGLFNLKNELIWLIQDSNSFFFLNRCGRTVSVIRDTRFGIGRTVPAIRDTRVRLVVLVYCHARATPRPTSSKCRNDCRLPCGPDASSQVESEVSEPPPPFENGHLWRSSWFPSPIILGKKIETSLGLLMCYII